ncbi:hypothetical protein ACFX15_002866 [Malus domestica]
MGGAGTSPVYAGYMYAGQSNKTQQPKRLQCVYGRAAQIIGQVGWLRAKASVHRLRATCPTEVKFRPRTGDYLHNDDAVVCRTMS